jgi:hypothetical protein
MNCPAIKCIFNIKLLIINLYYIIIKKKILLINYLDCKYFKWYSIQWIKYKKKKPQKVYYRCGEMLSDGIRHSDGTLALAATLTAHHSKLTYSEKDDVCLGTVSIRSSVSALYLE